MNVLLICPDNVLASGLTGIIDVLNIANRLNKKKLFEWQITSLSGRTLYSSQSTLVQTDVALHDVHACDVMIWIGSQFEGREKLWQHCRQVIPHKKHIQWLTAQSNYVLACCTGVSYMAMSDVLKDQRLTSCWWLKTFYNQYFPDLRVSQEAVYIQDGKFITAGAVQCYFPMMLHFIRQIAGQPLCEQLTAWLAMPTSYTSQSPFMVCNAFEQHSDIKLLELQHYIKDALNESLTVAVLARRLYVSERTLIRRFHKHVGLSPSAYVRLARLEKTKFLLRSTTDNFDIISTHVGYQDANALNKQFKVQYGTSMMQFRRTR